MPSQKGFIIVAAVVALTLSGCAELPVSLVAEGADAGLSFTSADSRSFTYPRPRVHEAALQALQHMQIKVIKDEEHKDERKMSARSKRLAIFLTLSSVTPAVTKVSVKAKKNIFQKDQTVAAEILIQMNRILRNADEKNAG